MFLYLKHGFAWMLFFGWLIPLNGKNVWIFFQISNMCFVFGYRHIFCFLECWRFLNFWHVSFAGIFWAVNIFLMVDMFWIYFWVPNISWFVLKHFLGEANHFFKPCRCKHVFSIWNIGTWNMFLDIAMWALEFSVWPMEF